MSNIMSNTPADGFIDNKIASARAAGEYVRALSARLLEQNGDQPIAAPFTEERSYGSGRRSYRSTVLIFPSPESAAKAYQEGSSQVCGEVSPSQYLLLPNGDVEAHAKHGIRLWVMAHAYLTRVPMPQ